MKCLANYGTAVRTRTPDKPRRSWVRTLFCYINSTIGMVDGWALPKTEKRKDTVLAVEKRYADFRLLRVYYLFLSLCLSVPFYLAWQGKSLNWHFLDGSIGHLANELQERTSIHHGREDAATKLVLRQHMKATRHGSALHGGWQQWIIYIAAVRCTFS